VGLFVFLGMFVYAIKSKIKNYIYVGISHDIEERLYRHNSGYEKTTKPYSPFELIYCIEKPTREEARIEEKRLKSTSGKRFLRSLLT
jgi:putative endonuclease